MAGRSIARRRGRERQEAAKAAKPPALNSNTEERASTTVGTVPELTEQVLLELPIRRLFILQQVNSQWRGLIRSSHRLKQKMLLMSRNKIEVDQTPASWPFDRCPEEQNLRAIPLLNVSCGTHPFDDLRKVFKFPGVTIEFTQGFEYCLCAPLHTCTITFSVTFSAIADGNQSWQNMMLTDPRPKKIYFNAAKSSMISESYVKDVMREDGFRLGDIYQAHKDVIKELGETGFGWVSFEDITANFYMSRMTTKCCEKHCWLHSYRRRGEVSVKCCCSSIWAVDDGT